ncbi:hypothetical protein BJ322DRAFT_1168921, partial [Thelephora terrestris]
MLDRRTTLCLACSSSLPPNVDDSELFITKCCGRPICPRCLETNPRLARYNPCLVCLAGVGVIQASSSSGSRPGGKPAGNTGAQSMKVENLNGGVKDQDLFVLGDDEDEGSDSEDDMSLNGTGNGRCSRSAAPPPPDVIQTNSALPKTPPPPPVPAVNTEESPVTGPTRTPPPLGDDQQSAQPALYRLRRGDTLMGIALRFRLDAMELCRLNDLPTTTLSTTPHLLHTRTTILLPPASKPLPETSALTEARRVERAEKLLQTVTKEVDWRVAKAYVALAQDPDPSSKEKADNRERGGSSQKGVLESDAIDRYLEDAEWEEQERKDGREPVIQKFPWGPPSQ